MCFFFKKKNPRLYKLDCTKVLKILLIHRQVCSSLSHKHIQVEGDKILQKKMLKALFRLKPTLQILMLMSKLRL